MFKANGLVTVNAGGSINANGKGYRGVTQKVALWRNADGGQGEGIYGTGIASGANGGSTANNSGAWLSANGNGGGGGTGTGDSGGGGGGGYANVGSTGVNWGHSPGLGGSAVGNSSVTLLIMGGAGGEGGADEDGAFSGAGGNGGGIVLAVTNSIIVSGNVASNGNIGNGASNGAPGSGCGSTAGGGGAGGSINLITNSFSGSGANLTVSGGTGGLSTGGCNSGGATGGAGSNGRIRLDMTGTLPVTNPVAYQGTTTIATGVTYLWSNGANTYSTVVTPSVTSNYTITITATSGCTGASSVVAVNVNPLPNVSVNSGAICNGNSFTMIPSGASTYTYSSGTAVVSPIANTAYTVTGTNALGCKNTAVSNVTVNALPTISVNSGAICSGDSFTMTPSGASTYTFSSGSPFVSPISNTTYSISGTNANGCVSSVSAISSVTVNALPTISVNSGLICAGNSFTMTPSGAISYTFSSASAIVTPASNTSYSVTGTDANGCISSVSAVSNVTVNALPIVTVNSGAICAGDSFTMVPGGALTYTFSSGIDVVTPSSTTSYTVTGTDANGCVSLFASSNVTVNTLPMILVNSGAICVGNSFTMNPTGAATYTFSNGSPIDSPTSNTSYTVTGTDANGCISAVAAVSSVTVNALPTISVNSGIICAGSSFTMNPTGASTYTFSNGSAVVSPVANTSYTVSGTDANGCTSAISAVSDVTVNALPTVVATSNNSMICSGQTAILSVSGAQSYTWNTTSNSTSISINPTTTTVYSVNGTDANGCSNTATITQNVSLCTGVVKLNNAISSISLYPNPNNGLFSLELNTTSQILIINTLGQVVFNETMNAGKQNLDILNAANGIYFVKVIQGNKQQTIKFIKE